MPVNKELDTGALSDGPGVVDENSVLGGVAGGKATVGLVAGVGG